MGYINESIRAFRRLSLKSANSTLEKLFTYGKGEHFVLNYLYVKKTAVLPSALSKELGSSTARISAILKTLEKKGEIVRDTDTAKRNNVLVSITPAGENRARRVQQEVDKSLSQVFGEMGEENAREYIRLSNLFLEVADKYPILESYMK